VSEWRDMSTGAKGAYTWNEDNVSEWRNVFAQVDMFLHSDTLSSFHVFAAFAQVEMSLHSDTLSSFHVFAPFAQVDMFLHSDTLSCLPEQREQRRGMRIMCLSGGTCLPEQREQRRMPWNEDNVSEWRDMSTRAKGAKTWNEGRHVPPLRHIILIPSHTTLLPLVR
jgi:hypothetical protein